MSKGCSWSGKINIVFGFFYLAITAVLGPAVLVPGLGEVGGAMKNASEQVEIVREAKGSQASIEKAETAAVVGIMDYLTKAKRLGSIASAAHAHGNLEALLNIVAGLVILSLVIPSNYKVLLSILFIAGACLHSGMLYLGVVFGQSWAFNLTFIGAICILAALVLTGIASIVGIKTKKTDTCS